jgi:hypothetical protein
VITFLVLVIDNLFMLCEIDCDRCDFENGIV